MGDFNPEVSQLNQKLLRPPSGIQEVGEMALSPHLLLSDYSVDLLYETLGEMCFYDITLCVSTI